MISVVPELEQEQSYLARARTELTRMREQTLSLEAHGGDRVSSEFLAAALYRRAQSLIDDPTTSLFFGRIDQDLEGDKHPERWYIGRRHVADSHGDPVVIDWRADVSRAFYRASRAEPMGVSLRRRFGIDHGQLTAFEDERLDRGDDAAAAGSPFRSQILCRRDRAAKGGADAGHRRHDPARAGRHRARRRGDNALHPGRPRDGQDRCRAAPGGLAALRLP